MMKLIHYSLLVICLVAASQYTLAQTFQTPASFLDVLFDVPTNGKEAMDEFELVTTMYLGQDKGSLQETMKESTPVKSFISLLGRLLVSNTLRPVILVKETDMNLPQEDALVWILDGEGQQEEEEEEEESLLHLKDPLVQRLTPFLPFMENAMSTIQSSRLGENKQALRLSFFSFEPKGSELVRFNPVTGAVWLSTTWLSLLPPVGEGEQADAAVLTQMLEGQFGAMLTQWHEAKVYLLDSLTHVETVEDLLAFAKESTGILVSLIMESIWVCIACTVVLAIGIPFVNLYILEEIAQLICNHWHLTYYDCTELMYGMIVVSDLLLGPAAYVVVKVCGLETCSSSL